MSVPTLKPRALTGLTELAQSHVRPHLRVIAPASNARADRLAAGAAALEARGYKVSFGEHAQGRQAPYFSGTAEARLADFHAAFGDSEVDVVMCTRGGYGSNYLLNSIDLDIIARNPKPFFAYSDLTAVQTWLMDQTGLVAFHGPMLAADFFLPDGVEGQSFAGSLSGELLAYDGSHGLRVLRPGSARGVLYGGCLTLLTASLGTPFAPRTEGKLLFLEDVAIKPYQLDRMLRQLLLAGKLESVRGIIFGEMMGCASPGIEGAAEAEARLEESILGALDWGLSGGFRGPIAIGLRSGHVSRANVTLPLNLEAELILEGEPVLRMREPAVVL